MAELVRMPEVLAGATEAAIQAWLIAEGEEIAAGTPIAEIETEKAMVEFNSEASGTVAALLVETGTTVSVGDPILVLRVAGDSDADVAVVMAGLGAASPGAEATAPAPAAASLPAVASPPAPTEAVAAAAAAAAEQQRAETSIDQARVFASPIVRRLVREHGIDLLELTGTGDNGRIVRRDVERHLAKAPVVQEQYAPAAAAAAPAEPERGDRVPLSGMRKAIARRLTESKTTVPHFYLTAHCAVDELLRLRAQVNEASPKRVSVNDFVVKAVAQALIEVPDANMIWGGDHLVRFDSADISVAVATDGGLLTPVVKGVESMSVSALSIQIADLAERARAGKLRQDELEGGSFAISNLGMYGVDEFSAILNPPQSGILAVGAATQRPVVVDGELAVCTMMTVTLSADHRVVDGAVGAQWLAAFKRRIEQPLSLLV